MPGFVAIASPRAFREAGVSILDAPPCGHPIFENGKLVAVCVEPCGTEHMHGAYCR